MGHVLSKEEFEDFLRWNAESVIDKVVDNAPEEMATEVMQEEGPQGGFDEDLDLAQGKEGEVNEMDVEGATAKAQGGLT